VTNLRCPFCQQPVDLNEPDVRPHIVGWFHPSDPDTVINQTPTGAFAHGRCVEAEELRAELERRAVEDRQSRSENNLRRHS
jgi:hypothetical protein